MTEFDSPRPTGDRIAPEMARVLAAKTVELLRSVGATDDELTEAIAGVDASLALDECRAVVTGP
jgi:hypothetical protein